MYRHNSNTIPVTYGELLDKLKKGRRKGNWKKLKRREGSVCMGAEAKGVAEGPKLYLLAGDGEVKKMLQRTDTD
ncbi:MAG: hypothetical protein KAU16_01430 [Methanophagales archaeon]|nr:hypothetical protein [Methanophagales archaeon]